MLTTLLACLLSVPAAAQGFNSFSGRNHPELRWQVAETEHFRIMYPSRIAGIEAEAAAVAEASYAALAKNLRVTFDEKIRIYLSDEDEILNGFAVPIGAGYTNIWVHQNDGAWTWTGREKWLRKVIAHELAHIFHYRAVRSSLGVYANVFATPLPRFWTEGLAQYETETWDAQRGDRWLRTAVLDDRLSYEDGRSAWNGRLLYAVGNAQVRYFAQQYGDSTLAELLAHRKPALFGLAQVHDFYDAFEAVTGQSYRSFYDAWRRDVNVYYNTLAGQLEPLDSLQTDPLALPGQYLYDVAYSPDTSRVALLALPSLVRPVRRLIVVDREAKETEIVAEGSIDGPVAWSPDGRRLAFSRLRRGRSGALLNDLYVVEADGGGLHRVTESRRAASPAWSPDGTRLAFVGSAGGTANVFVLDLATGRETQVTWFEGDVQIGTLRWHPSGARLAMARFGSDGTRDVATVELASGVVTAVTDGVHDDREPVWSPAGRKLAYTSLRDDIPNVYIADLATGAHRRVTALALGATATDWLPPDSLHADGSLVVVVNASKQRDRAYRIDAGRTPAAAPTVAVPPPYAAWTAVRPPEEVGTPAVPQPELITARYPYNAWKNLTHAASLALPYYDSPSDWGLFGFTSWIEPLAKHGVFLAGSVSVPSFWEESFVYGTYLTNRWRPSVAFNAYLGPGTARLYGNEVLVDKLTGGDVTATWPLDLSDRPFVSEAFALRLRYADVRPYAPERFESVDGLKPPGGGQQADLRIGYTRRFQRPYRYNLVHPLDGRGVRLRLTGAAKMLGADQAYVRGDVAAYTVLPALGLQRLYLYGRAQAQTGTSLPQDYIGLGRYDDVQVAIPGFVPFTLGDAERVRGYRRYALGDRMVFGTAAYRMLLLPDLRTQLFGVVALGSTAAAVFADGGIVWSGRRREDRLGVGVELNNALRLGGVVEIGHALGVAQRSTDVGTTDRLDVYYRIRAAVPF